MLQLFKTLHVLVVNISAHQWAPLPTTIANLLSILKQNWTLRRKHYLHTTKVLPERSSYNAFNERLGGTQSLPLRHQSSTLVIHHHWVTSIPFSVIGWENCSV